MSPPSPPSLYYSVYTLSIMREQARVYYYYMHGKVNRKGAIYVCTCKYQIGDSGTKYITYQYNLKCPLFEVSFIWSVLYQRFHCITMCLCIHIVIDVDFQQHHFYKPSHDEGHNISSASTKKSGKLPVKTPPAARSKDKTKIPQNRITTTRSHSLQASRYTRLHCNNH